MCLEVAALSKLLATILARKRPFASVTTHVGLQQIDRE
jgi:hypothetical protein